MAMALPAGEVVDLSLLVSFLNCHALPSVIVNFIKEEDNPKHLSLIYANASFTAWLEDAQLSHRAFKEWAENSSIWDGLEHGKTRSMPYSRLTWAASRVGESWGILQSQSGFEEHSSEDSDYSARPHKRARTESLGEFLWGCSTSVCSSVELQHFTPSSTISSAPGDSSVRI